MNNIMNKILNCDDIWKYIIIPYIGPRLFRCSELRSVSTRFSELFPPCHLKSKYIKVPSDKYKTLEDAYQYISDLLYGYCYCSGDYTKPPEIWLDYGIYENINNTIRIPVIIRGMGMDRTIIKNGFKFEINDTILFGRESAGVPERIHKLMKHKLKIPMEDRKRSLNISSSVAIILAESFKQNKIF